MTVYVFFIFGIYDIPSTKKKIYKLQKYICCHFSKYFSKKGHKFNKSPKLGNFAMKLFL